ncbi:bone morphoproteintic protein [Chamberlinius hualienensis]
MMFQWTFLCSIFLILFCECHLQETNETETQLAFKQLLRVKTLPSLGERNYANPLLASPPRYMFQLYEKYRRGDVNVNRGNTVRSILPFKGVLDDSDVLLFNVSCLNKQSETLLRSELHLNKRKKIKWINKRLVDHPSYRLLIYCSPDDMKLLNIINLTIYGHWQLIDFTNFIRECRQHRLDLAGDTILVVKGQGLNSNNDYIDIPMRNLIRIDQAPFLIVFSHDKRTTKQNDDLSEKFYDKFKLNYDVLIDKQETKVLTSSDDGLHPLKRLVRALDYVTKRKTLMSWVDTNEFPENSVVYETNLISKIGPKMLNERKRKKQSSKSLILNGQVNSPFGHKRRIKKKQKGSNNLPTSWQNRNYKGKSVLKTANEAVPGACGCKRKNLSLTFAEMGWHDVIAPEKFEAFYCSGECTFPISMESKPSNHAIIQSLVNAAGVKAEVPAPTCVANSMSSLTLLYLDENGEVVLKNYPEMIAETCSCR